MTNPTADPNEEARRLAEHYLEVWLSDRRGVGQELRSIRDQDPTCWAEIVQECTRELFLPELLEIERSAREECAKFGFPDEDRPNLWAALNALDAARGKR